MPNKASMRARRKAIALDESMYQGEPCAIGHAGKRYVANRACVECAKQTSRMAYDKAAATARKRAYRAKLKAQAAASLGADILKSL